MATTKTSAQSGIKSMNFEASLLELEGIVKRLEGGKETLEDAIEAYTRGSALVAHCTKKLNEARLTIEKITVGPDGSVAADALDISQKQE